MRRREFIVALIYASAASWSDAAAQSRLPVIGFLSVGSPESVGPTLLDAFHKGLREAGYQEGRDVAVEYRWAEGLYDRLPTLAADLVSRRVNVIVAAGGTVAALAVRAATGTIPVIILAGDDPVRLGLVQSLNRPGGNITGVAQLVIEVEGKRLELLRELVPRARAIAFLSNPSRPGFERQRQSVEAAAQALGIALVTVEAGEESEFAPAIAKAKAAADALIVAADPFFFARRHLIVDLITQRALPAMYFFREFVTEGGLISYGSDLTEAYREVGAYTGKILRGANPAELPIVQQSDKLHLVINLKTAKALGIAVPLTLQAQADEVIE